MGFRSGKRNSTRSIVWVLLGEKIVLDGIVKKGSGTCNESLMSGEPMPVVKGEGDRVLAGSILQSGYLEIEVMSTSEETALHRILQMCENDIARKSLYVRAVDPWVKAFVPFVLIFAACVFGVCLFDSLEVAVMRMMAVLLISCPCAIGIAAPLAESHLMHALTNMGVIVRNRGVLSILGLETVMFSTKREPLPMAPFGDLGMQASTPLKGSSLKV